MIGPTNIVVVPAGFSLWPGADSEISVLNFLDDVDLRPDKKWLTRDANEFDPETVGDDADRPGGRPEDELDGA